METQALKPFSLPHVSSQRFISIGFVALIHVALVYALISMKVIDVDIFVPPEELTYVKLPPTTAPPPPLQPTKPRVNDVTVFVPQPDVEYATDAAGPTGLSTPRTNTVPVVAIPATAPVGILRTITRPVYPAIEKRLGHEGMVSLRLMISADGIVTDAIVVRSSGFPRLDEAAVSHVIAHWRYKPATREGKPVTSQTNANVKFELVN